MDTRDELALAGFIRLLRRLTAADQLVRRGNLTDAALLYQHALKEFAPMASLAPDESSRPGAASLVGVRTLRRDLAAALRDEWRATLGPWERVARGVRLAMPFCVVFVILAAGGLGWSREVRRDLAENAHFTASSTFGGAPKSGTLPAIGPFGDVPNYFFHTEKEDNPHVDIDLGTERAIETVEITTRIDCCPERRRDLELWTGPDPGALHFVARRAPGDESRVWTVNTHDVRARFVRVTVSGNRFLHLARVRAFGK